MVNQSNACGSLLSCVVMGSNALASVDLMGLCHMNKTGTGRERRQWPDRLWINIGVHSEQLSGSGRAFIETRAAERSR